MHNNRRQRSHSHERYERSEKHDQETPRQYRKSIILLKSSVFALFIVFVVSLAAFEIIKHRKESSEIEIGKCEKIKTISIAQNIESLKVGDDVITILTKSNSKGEQEIIRFSADCGRELNKILFKVKQ